ncbi:TPX2 central domain [Dillenia turbinata]|uniref:TPX2 central domain n=1 Tax=Dillenia turbinata TaxID=194707 RepID=A0AAN8VW77_9MAGN
MDKEMELDENEVEQFFVVVEIDQDYEFDAAMYFDFSREESAAEAREAELWFETAKSYPPSRKPIIAVAGEAPIVVYYDSSGSGIYLNSLRCTEPAFIAKLVLSEEMLLENVTTSPKPKDAGTMTVDATDPNNSFMPKFSVEDGKGKEFEGFDEGTLTTMQSGILQKTQNQPQQFVTGLTFNNHTTEDVSKAKTKPSVKPHFPRSSTLMKPTASQLAKQSQPLKVGDSRFRAPPVQCNGGRLNNPFHIENQAAKRQKLEGGVLHKVQYIQFYLSPEFDHVIDSKQPTNLVHKMPKKDEIVGKNSMLTRLRLTIPREPDLETAHRAQRIRPKDGTEVEQVASTVRRFKAHPLNRKILEAPLLSLPKKSTPKLPEFQEFHLKTMERAMQNVVVSSSSNHPSQSEKGVHKPSLISIPENGKFGPKRPSYVDIHKQEKCEPTNSFKARPLNKKIFTSKGDIGVFRNNKREMTVPKEFNFQTDKRNQQNPPTDLFSKLSLTSEVQTSKGSQLKLPQPCTPKMVFPVFQLMNIKNYGSKENRWGPLEQQMTNGLQGKLSTTGEQTDRTLWRGDRN